MHRRARRDRGLRPRARLAPAGRAETARALERGLASGRARTRADARGCARTRARPRPAHARPLRPRAARSNQKTVLGTGGFRGDITTLQKILRAKVTQYEHKHNEMILPHAVAQDLANTLYGRRFFPYYTWNVLAGLDQDGVGVVYTYDPVGNYERVRVSVTGSGESLIQPLLDNQLERQHQALGAKPPPLHIDLELADAVDLVKDAFVSAGERDIKTGDSVEICIITKEGVRIETHPLNID